MQLLIIYLAAVNLAAFLTYGWDKMKAKRNEWRVPEKTLLALAVVGGSVGALAGMQFFHHKTRKWKFKVGVPLILLIQIALILWMGR